VARVARQLAYSPLAAISLTSGRHQPIAQGRNPYRDPIAQFQTLNQVLPQGEAQPDVVQVHQREQRYAGRDDLALLNVDLIDCVAVGAVTTNWSTSDCRVSPTLRPV